MVSTDTPHPLQGTDNVTVRWKQAMNIRQSLDLPCWGSCRLLQNLNNRKNKAIRPTIPITPTTVPRMILRARLYSSGSGEASMIGPPAATTWTMCNMLSVGHGKHLSLIAYTTSSITLRDGSLPLQMHGVYGHNKLVDFYPSQSNYQTSCIILYFPQVPPF